MMDEQREWHEAEDGFFRGIGKKREWATSDYLNALEQRVREAEENFATLNTVANDLGQRAELAEAERCCLCGGVEDEHLPGEPTAPYKLDATEDHEFYRPVDIQDVSQYLQQAEAELSRVSELWNEARMGAPEERSQWGRVRDHYKQRAEQAEAERDSIQHREIHAAEIELNAMRERAIKAETALEMLRIPVRTGAWLDATNILDAALTADVPAHDATQ